MKIKLTSIYVDDQEKALRFYTDILGFVKKGDVTNGGFRWLTVASSEDPGGIELQLALNSDPAAKAYQQAQFQQAQPAAMFHTDDLQRDYDRLTGLGVLRHRRGRAGQQAVKLVRIRSRFQIDRVTARVCVFSRVVQADRVGIDNMDEIRQWNRLRSSDRQVLDGFVIGADRVGNSVTGRKAVPCERQCIVPRVHVGDGIDRDGWQHHRCDLHR